jgi:hypothetical protein
MGLPICHAHGRKLWTIDETDRSGPDETGTCNEWVRDDPFHVVSGPGR